MQNVLKSKIFIGTVLALAAAAVITIFAVNAGQSGGSDLQAQLDLGKKYVSELDYENAIIAYEDALKIDPYCLDAYLGLADAYMALGQQDKAMEIMEQAKAMLPDSVEVYVRLAEFYASQNQIGLVVSTLEEGIRVTDSDRLREMLRAYQPDEAPVEMAERSGTVSETQEREEPSTDNQEADASLMIGLQPDTERENAAPVVTISRNDGEPVVIPVSVPEAVPVRGESIWNEPDSTGDGNDNNDSDSDSGESSGGSSGDHTDAGEDSGSRTGIMGMVSGADGRTIEGVTVSVYSGEDETPIMTVTDREGNYRQDLSSAGIYRIVLSKEGYVDLSTSATVWENVFHHISYMMLTEEESRQMASLNGIVLSAVDDRSVDGASVTLLEGFDQTTGGSQNGSHTLTGNDGRFSMEDEINAGYYTMQVSKDGYSTYIHNETIKPGENAFNIVISPEIQTSAEYRIVLTWGETPRDLDSHLICTGDSNYHVYFGMKDYRGSGSSDQNENGTSGERTEYASLDRDDVTSYGPETTTVKVKEGNSYIYAVHNFTNGSARPGQAEAWNLAHSGAKVVVYDGNGIIFDGNVPTDQEGITWEVFRIENGRLVVTNQISFNYPGAGASAVALMAEDEAYGNGLEAFGDEEAGIVDGTTESVETVSAVNDAVSGTEGIAGSDVMSVSTEVSGDEITAGAAGSEAVPGSMGTAGDEAASESPATAEDEDVPGNTEVSADGTATGSAEMTENEETSGNTEAPVDETVEESAGTSEDEAAGNSSVEEAGEAAGGETGTGTGEVQDIMRPEGIMGPEEPAEEVIE